MGGGLLNLVAYGNKNIITNGNPSKTFFKATYTEPHALSKFSGPYKFNRELPIKMMATNTSTNNFHLSLILVSSFTHF